MNKINNLIDWISAVVASEKVIIVEGSKDRKALINIGIGNKIIMINGSDRGLFNVVEKAAKNKKIILLTDMDKKGKELYGKLRKDLCRLGVEVDNKFREWLQRNTKLSHIEGIDNYMMNDENLKKNLF
ncbi:MAG: toprim domain-containing protein [Candidatus Woesearchaeota archaeon]